MVFFGAVAGVFVAVESGAVAEVSAAFEPLAVGGGKWLPDPSTQPTIPRTMTTALIATIKNLFIVLPHVLWNAFSAKTCNAFESLNSSVPAAYWTPDGKQRFPNSADWRAF